MNKVAENKTSQPNHFNWVHLAFELFKLCKPKIVMLILITALAGMLLASFNHFSLLQILSGSAGIGLLASAGAVLNNILDKNNDILMRRTQKRGVASGAVSVKVAYFFMVFLVVLGFVILYWWNNALSAVLTLLSMFGYGFIYTYYLKYMTVQNIVIGGISGSMPPLLGWTAITNSLDPYPMLLVLIIFVWTPSHFWALAIHKRDEYAQLDYPVLPVVYGKKLTSLHIFLYSILLFIACLLPFLIGKNSYVYLLLACLLNAQYIRLSFKLLKDESVAFNLFKYSVQYLGILFLVIVVDYYLYNFFI